MSRLWLLALAVLFFACGGTKQKTLVCVNDSQCTVNGVVGKCVQPDQRCAIPKASCDSGYAYDATAGALAGNCVSLPPPALKLGDACTNNEQCDGGVCADGFCCNDRCSGKCTSCAVPGSEGRCSAVPAGVPDPRNQCANDKTPCGRDGTCDGSGGCRIATPDTVCKPSTCTTGAVTPTSKCDGSGNCVTPPTRACDPYQCNAEGTDCYSSCTAGDSHCKPPQTCSANSCGLSGLGATCTVGDQCKSGHCLDKTCCDTATCDPCYACNLNGVGTCAPKGAGATDTRCVATAQETCGIKGDACSATGCALWGPADGNCSKSHCHATDSQWIWQAQTCDGVHARCPDLVLTKCMNMCYPYGDNAACL